MKKGSSGSFLVYSNLTIVFYEIIFNVLVYDTLGLLTTNSKFVKSSINFLEITILSKIIRDQPLSDISPLLY